MRHLAAFGFALIAALALSVGFAQATADSDGTLEVTAPPTGVRYDWYGGIGELNILSEPGREYLVLDAAGVPVAAGVLAEPVTSVIAPNCGFGPDGAILYVQIGVDDVRVVDDPDWEWH